MRIFFLTNLLSPYRVEWLNQLCESNSIDAFYLTAEEDTRDSKWLSSSKPLFACKQVERGGFTGRSASKAFFDTIRQSDYDIYIIDGYSSAIKLKTLRLLLRRGKKVYINIDGIDIWRAKSKADIIKDRIKRGVFTSGAYFLCGSKLAADTVISCGADERRVFVHPFTSLHRGDIIDGKEKPFLQKQMKQKLGVGDKKLVLAVGRFIPIKRYDCLIRAWRDMPGDRVLYIIGGGQEKESYERLIRGLGAENIELLDFMVPEMLNDYFLAADIFVHPSSTETWGLVVNEAMAKGCPVIATNRCVAAVELITEGREGYLTEVGDDAGLREKMQKLLSDDALRAEMSANAVERISSYTYENLAAVHLKIFEDTAKNI